MAKLFKKVVSALVAAQMALSLLSGTAFAASELKQIGDWKIYFNGGAKGDAYIDSENAYSGTSSLKITQTTASAANLYINAQHAVTVEAGKTYKVGAKMKSLRSTTLQFVVSWDKRRNLAPFGSTFDWTNYEFEFVAQNTGTETLMLIIDGTSDGVWLDDVYFTDVETGKNLITDGTFESDDDSAADIGESAVDPEITKIYNKVLTADSFSAEEMEKVIGGFKYMPVYRADGIKIDGKGDDWAAYTPGAMPTLPTQYQVYISDERAKDVSAIWKFAQDEENLYLYIEVTDDVFYYSAGGKDYYWRGDSIQFALSKTDESYGTEFGLAHNPQTGEGEVYSSSLSSSELASINLKTSVSGNKTIYEVAIPWNIKFNSRPQEFLFDFLVNDNDGDGRRYCLELAPGISEGKSNAVFPRMEIIDGGDDWYVWAQGDKTAYTNGESMLTYFLVNKGAAKTFEVTYADGNTETVEVPAESGIRREYKFTFDAPAVENVVATFTADGDEKAVSTQITVKDKPATKAEHEKVMETNTKHVREIKRLLKQCDEKGISTDYENVNYQVMLLFEDYLAEYLDKSWFDNTYYCERTLNELYTEAKENLTAYLNGTKEPMPSVPTYVTSDTTFKGSTAYALTELDGKIEERPLTFMGYCLFARNKDDIYKVRDLGANTVQMEIGPTEIVSNVPTYVEGQPVQLNLDPAKVATLRERLETAQELDVAVTLLLSPHYFPSAYIDANNMRQSGESWMFLKYNVNHPAAKAYIKAWLEAIVPIVKEYDSVQNLLISNEPAWKVEYSGDYYLDDWHEYLSEKYNGNIDELNEAYGENHASFSEIDFVRTNLVKSYDYKNFNSDVFNSWHKWMADIVHEIAPDIPVNSKIMLYTDSNHAYGVYNGTDIEKYSEWMDVNGTDMDDLYEERDEEKMSATMWIDYMRSIKDVPIVNSEDHIIANRYDVYDEVVGDYVARGIYMSSIHGRAVSDIWAWDRQYDEVGDFNDSILFRPDTLAKVHKTLLNLNRNSYEIEALQNREPEIGILYLDSSRMGDSATPWAMYQSYLACMFSGKSVRFVVESQLEKMKDCEMLIIANCKYVSENVLKAIEDYVKDGGKVIILNDESLKRNEKHLDNDSAVVDSIYENAYVIDYVGAANEIKNMTSEEFQDKIRDIFAENNLLSVTVRDAETGECINNTEINIAYYDGKTVLNMCNYDETKKVNVYLGESKVTSMYDINNCVTLEKDVELKQYIPLTVTFENENPFVDTYGHWAEENIVELYKKGVAHGVSETEYAPQKTLTRAEFLALLVRCFENGTSGEKAYPSDVTAESWYAGAVSEAVARGIISKEENFRPNDGITREEMCEFIVKCYESENGEISASDKAEFTDADSIGNAENVAKAVEAGFMFGRDDGRFDPDATATRAEAASVVLRYIDKN